MDLDIEPELLFQHKKCLDLIRPDQDFHGHPVLHEIDVLNAHFLIADFFYRAGEGIGGVGPRDIGLFQSTIDRQTVSLGGQYKWTTPFEIAATLLFGIVSNHPFYDANKRTALVAAAMLLMRSKISLTLSEDKLVAFTSEIASHELGRFPRFRDLVRQRVDDPEIQYISWYLRENSRHLIRSHHSITFREMAKTLRSFGYSLENPRHNTIDVVYIGHETRRPSIFPGFEIGERACNIGFPGWSKQVTKGDVKRIRESLNLLPRYSIDSDTFFMESDPLTNLISSYEGALRKLAFL